MKWEFKVNYKCIYDNEFVNRWKYLAYDARILTWSEAWHKCVDDAIRCLDRNEVIISIESTNDIVRCLK